MLRSEAKINANRGSALITVLAVITIVMVVVLSVLAMSYRYFMMEQGSVYRQKGDEAARSLSEELGDELMQPSYTTAAAAEADTGLWSYVRRNMGPGWGYLDSGRFTREAYTGGTNDPFVVSLNAAATPEDARRVFTLNADGALKDEVPETEVVLYWEPGRYTDRMNESRLYIEVSNRMGDHVTVITRRYKLSTLTFNEGGGSLDKSNGYYTYQNWVWTYDGEM